VGNSVADGWDAVCHGRSGIGPITAFDVSELSTRIGGEIRDFEVTDYISGKDARRYDKFMHYGLSAAQDAMREAGLLAEDHGADPERVGFAIGAGIGGIASIEENMLIYRDKGPRRVSPFYIPGSIVNMIGGVLSITYGFKGPNMAVVTACTTSTHNIGLAARLIRYGDADVMVAGGSQAVRNTLPHPRRWPVSSPPRPCPPAMTIRRAPAAPGTATGTASCWPTGPGSWSSRNSNTRGGGARTSTRRSVASA
jgi:3-oxoacyl-[acyl-carrier-protein] synthase II